MRLVKQEKLTVYRKKAYLSIVHFPLRTHLLQFKTPPEGEKRKIIILKNPIKTSPLISKKPDEFRLVLSFAMGQAKKLP